MGVAEILKDVIQTAYPYVKHQPQNPFAELPLKIVVGGNCFSGKFTQAHALLGHFPGLRIFKAKDVILQTLAALNGEGDSVANALMQTEDHQAKAQALLDCLQNGEQVPDALLLDLLISYMWQTFAT